MDEADAGELFGRCRRRGDSGLRKVSGSTDTRPSAALRPPKQRAPIERVSSFVVAALNDGNCLSLPRSAGSASLLGSLKISPHAWSRCCSRFFTRIAAARPKRRSGGGNERGILGKICSVGYRISGKDKHRSPAEPRRGPSRREHTVGL